MKKLYYDSAYTKEFDGTVLSCRQGKKGYEIILDQTAFYPEGGGQPSDTGTLGGVAVLEVHERAGEIIHYTDGALTPGKQAHGRIDWEKRFLHMQEHSGEHLVSGMIHARYGYDNVGFHMGSEEVTIDFNGVLDWDGLMEIEKDANAVIYENREILAGFPPKEKLEIMEYRSKKELAGEIRIVEIPGGDICACCGTHVKRTGEIGIVKFLSMIHYKGGVRISLVCGSRALADYEGKREQIQRISNLLSVKPGETADAVDKLKGELAGVQEKLVELYRRIIEEKAEKCLVADGNLAVYEPQFEPAQLRRLANRLIEKKKGKNVLALSCHDDGMYFYILGSQSGDMRLLSRELNGKLRGKGGGSMQMAQGTFYASPDEICAILKENGFSTPETCSGSGVRNLSDYAL